MAFKDAIGATATNKAPRCVIPSNHKWFHNLAVSRIMAATMEKLGVTFPKPPVDLAEIGCRYRAAKREQRDRRCCRDGADAPKQS